MARGADVFDSMSMNAEISGQGGEVYTGNRGVIGWQLFRKKRDGAR